MKPPLPIESIRMRDLRNRYQLTQPEMAKKLGVSLSAYTAWEQGKNLRTLRFAFLLANVMARAPRRRRA